MKKLISITAILLVIVSAYAQSPQAIYKEISQLKATGAIPKEMQIVKFLSTEIHERDYNLEGLNKGTVVNLSNDEMEELLLNRPDFIQIDFPVSERSEIK